MDKKKLTKLTIIEASKLREFATKKELSKLNFKTLCPNRISDCIYGQMTGDCRSNRAAELITNCAPKSYKETSLNGKATKEQFYNRTISIFNVTHYSPIEIFICQDENEEENNKILINYLKGKSDKLDFKPIKNSK